jgi:hypothetical protein
MQFVYRAFSTGPQAAGPDAYERFVRAESGSRHHFFNPVVRFGTTVIGRQVTDLPIDEEALAIARRDIMRTIGLHAAGNVGLEKRLGRAK